MRKAHQKMAWFASPESAGLVLYTKNPQIPFSRRWKSISLSELAGIFSLHSISLCRVAILLRSKEVLFILVAGIKKSG